MLHPIDLQRKRTATKVSRPLDGAQRVALKANEGMAKILVVDDEASTRKALVLSLSGEGDVVLDADSKDTALARLCEQHFDVLITDLFVPTEIAGMEILRTCKARQPEALLRPCLYSAAQFRRAAHRASRPG